MFFALFFVLWRIAQILTLIPVVGMLAWFVDGFVEDNLLTPNYILVLFIVSVLGLAWALFTVFSYHRSSSNASCIAAIDLLFMGAFIAGAYFLRRVTDLDCANISRDDRNWVIYFGGLGVVSGPNFDVDVDKSCSMLKACFAFAIMNVIMFFFTAVLAWMHGDDKSTRRERRHDHGRRHSHRSRSRHSHHSRGHSRSSHSRHRVYV